MTERISILYDTNENLRRQNSAELFILKEEIQTMESRKNLTSSLTWDNGGNLAPALEFLRLDLTDRQVMALLRQLDVLYGCTDQDIEVWACEFQVITRMLLFQQALVLNPQYLLLEDELDCLLGNDATKEWHRVRKERGFEGGEKA